MTKMLAIVLSIAFAAPILGSSAYAGSRQNAQGQQGGNWPIAQSAPPCAAEGSGAITQSGAIAQSEPPLAPDPSYRNVIADCLKTTFKTYATYELFEISDPRWVSSIKGWNWLVCVRFVDRGHRRNYALLFNGSTVVDGHYAYQTDACSSQAYVAFEQMGGVGLPPLH
jgi:hypothetical protein